MKLLLVIALSFMLAGCGGMTRLLPKLDKIELPEELMVPPKELKTIEKPPTPQSELARDVPPQR